MEEEGWTLVSNINTNKWQEEEDDDIKENWDDDDEEETSRASLNDEQQQRSGNTTAEQKPEKTSKKKHKLLKEKLAQKESETNQRVKTAEELLAEKLERQRLVEEGDLALAKDTFGVSGTNDSSALDSIRLATKEDFDEFLKALSEKLDPFSRSPYYLAFLDNLFRGLTASLEPDNIRKLVATLNAVCNEKIKGQKAKQQVKGKKAKKNSGIRLERDTDYTFNQYEDYDKDFDDFC